MSGWLVVNPNIQFTDQTRQHVNAHGFPCETAHDWRTAEQRLQNNDFDVIVVDSSIDTCDGIPISEHVTSEASTETKVVVFGGATAAGIRDESVMLEEIDQLLEQIN